MPEIILNNGKRAIWGYPKIEAFVFSLPAAISTETERGKTLKGIHIYPNPATKEFFIRKEDSDAIGIFLSDINGRIILHKESNSSETSVDIGSLEKGTYLVKIKKDAQILISKIVKN